MNREEIEALSNKINFTPLKHIIGDIYLNDNQIAVLEKYKINYKNCNSLQELIYELENYINDNYYTSDIEDLDWVSQSLSEFNYYNNTNK